MMSHVYPMYRRVLLQPTFETVGKDSKNRQWYIYESLTVPVYRPDENDEKEELGTTNDTDCDECRSDGKRANYGTTKVI
jgi:hypothetical protein